MIISVPEYAQFHKFKAIVIVWLVSASLGDVIITTALVWYLVSHRYGLKGQKLIAWSAQAQDRVLAAHESPGSPIQSTSQPIVTVPCLCGPHERQSTASNFA